jgi:hypothetical protein
MANTYMKKCSIFLTTEEMQIKITLRFYFTSIRMTTINNTNNKCWQVFGTKETLIHYWWECKLVQPLWKAVWRFLEKLKVHLPYDLVIPPLGIQPKECKAGYIRATCSPMFIAALFIITKL